MKHLAIVLVLLSMCAFSTAVFADYMIMDGDSSDWAMDPIQIVGEDNVDGLFPAEVGAAITDNVDVKHVRAKIVDNVAYTFIRFQGGPAWPNEADKGEYEGVPVQRSRGYYHLMLDLDNDPSTGWNSGYYEAHYTPVGYLESQGVEGQEHIGAEAVIGTGFYTYRSAPDPDSAGIKNSGIKSVSYFAADVSEYDAVSDGGTDYEIFDTEVNDPDSAKSFQWSGALQIGSSDLEGLAEDKYYHMAHAWGEDWIEFAMELTPLKHWFASKGKSYFQEGDVIGITAMIETPADDWGTDIPTRGEMVCPAMPMRPNAINFDGDESDWAGMQPIITAIDNVDGLYPADVGAAVTDNVDIKEVKAFYQTDTEVLYWNLKMWGGPVWPNEADKGDYEGVPVQRSRGYYHVLLDFDNDPTTGWNSHYYEGHYTPVGYLASQGAENTDPIGTELWVEFGARTYKSAPDPDSAGIKNSGVAAVNWWLADWSQYVGENDGGTTWEFTDADVTDPDSAAAMKFDAYLANGGDFETGKVFWNAHAWGDDFLEVGTSMTIAKMWWMEQYNQEILKPGDVVGIAGFNETPADDWGCDMTARGEIVIAEATGIADGAAVVEGYKLSDNYPNPFNPTTSISYTVPQSADVSIEIFNTLGQKIRTLVDGKMAAGEHTVNWNGMNDAGQSVSSGIYFYRMVSDQMTVTKNMVLLK